MAILGRAWAENPWNISAWNNLAWAQVGAEDPPPEPAPSDGEDRLVEIGAELVETGADLVKIGQDLLHYARVRR